MRTMKIGRNDAGQRLDKFLAKAVRGLPASLMYKFIRTKKIKVNRARAEQSQLLREGDEIQLFIKDEFFGAPSEDKVRWARSVPNWISCMRTSIFCCSTSAPACWFTMTPQAAKTR